MKALIMDRIKTIFIFTFSVLSLCVATPMDFILPLDDLADIKSNLVNDGTEAAIITTSKQTNLKYILQWASSKDDEPLLLTGQKSFIDRNCSFTNCYITFDRFLFEDHSKYDVITFGPDLSKLSSASIPQQRLPHQKYVFLSSEPGTDYPLPSYKFDGFFNWTWTYNLDSDLQWGVPFVVRSKADGNIIGPKTNMNWMRRIEMQPTSEEIRNIVFGKRRTAAWFVSNCNTSSKREEHAMQLRNILLNKYKLHLDIYGKCGELKCPKEVGKLCNKMLQKNYFFYLAYEKSIAEDYVTDKVLRALNYNTVPIVFGGANYSRFLPEGSYLNAREMSIESLAAQINELVRDLDKYLLYFKWKNHYTFHSTADKAETNDYCKMCALLNNEKKMSEISVQTNFTNWWNKPSKKPTNRNNNLKRKVYARRAEQYKHKMKTTPAPDIDIESLIDKLRKPFMKIKNYILYCLGMPQHINSDK